MKTDGNNKFFSLREYILQLLIVIYILFSTFVLGLFAPLEGYYYIRVPSHFLVPGE